MVLQRIHRIIGFVSWIAPGFVFILGWALFAWGETVVVTNSVELSNAVGDSNSGDIILVDDGYYPLAGTGTIVVRTPNMTIRSRSGNRSAVLIAGWGMYADGHNGIWVAADGVTISDITIQDVRYHCIQTDVNVDRLIVQNCILRDAGEQILKVPASTSGQYSEDGLVEGCLFEYSAGVGPRSYMGGIDVHRGKGWIVRDNLFRDIRSPYGAASEHAIHFWNDSRDTLVERNRIINCDRGIGFGNNSRGHRGGMIRNNMITHDGRALPEGGAGFNDVGIGLESAPGAKVYHNSIFFMHPYQNAIEYRFGITTDVHIANNLVNRIIKQREGAVADIESNISNAVVEWFADPAAGDLHLSHAVAEVVDQGVSITTVNDDIDLQARPQGTGSDIGADEFQDCRIDPDGDGDVDGLDLYEIQNTIKTTCLSDFCTKFGTE